MGKIIRSVTKYKQKNFSVIDLGGGTGHWAQRIKTHFPQATITIVEQSESMLSISRETLSQYDHIKFINGDILKENINETFDVCICIYVSMFIKNQSKLFQQISEFCHRGSKIIFVGQNVHHTVSMLVSNNQIEEALQLLESGYAKITEYHPNLYLLSREDIISLTAQHDISIDNLGTFPKFCRVGIREKMTDLNYSISDVLRKKSNFELLKKMEYNKIWDESLGIGIYWLLSAEKGE